MGLFQKVFGSAEQRSLEDPAYKLSENPEALMQLLGAADANNALPPVSIEAALQVPALFNIVGFLSRTLAVFPIHSFEEGENGKRIDDDLAALLNDSPNPEWSSFDWRRYHWQQVFTGGRGVSWIERMGTRPVAIWPMDPDLTTVRRVNGRKIYRHDGRDYAAQDVIDTPFMLKRDMLGSYSPIAKCNKAISLAIAMGDFAGGFFASGGVPPYALESPLPNGVDGMKRAQEQIRKAIELARKAGSNFFGMPPGAALKPVGLDPSKGQMVEARLFQVQELARIYSVPPAFMQDLSKGTFANTEQQDLQLAKHLIVHWAVAFESELNLKLFGWQGRTRKVKHNISALMRGDLKSRLEAFARAIQSAQLTPDEVRALDDRPAYPDGLGAVPLVQGATVPLGTPPAAGLGHNGGPPLNDNEEEGDDDADEDAED